MIAAGWWQWMAVAMDMVKAMDMEMEMKRKWKCKCKCKPVTSQPVPLLLLSCWTGARCKAGNKVGGHELPVVYIHAAGVLGGRAARKKME